MDVDEDELLEANHPENIANHPENVARNPNIRIPRLNRNVRRNRIRVRAPRAPRVLKYNYEWEYIPSLRRWISSHPDGESYALCTVCNKKLGAKLSTIKSHARTVRHRRLLPEDNNEDDDDGDDARELFKKAVAKAKLRISVLFVRYKLPFKLINGLLPVIVQLAQDLKVLKSIKMKRETLKNITVNAVAAVHKLNLKQALIENKFSILFDESTDVSTSKHGCVVVRYFNEEQNKIMSALWDVIPIYDIDDEESAATAEAIYGRIMQSFDNFQEIPKDNVMSFCSDGCNTMFGQHNSVSQRFRRDFPGIFNVSCPCHAVHLVGAGAFKELPEEIQQFPRDVYNSFNSSKRLHMLRQNQIAENVDIHRILRPVPTRWLVMGPVIERIIEQWRPIILTLNAIENPTEQITRLKDIISDPVTKYYAFFLKYILPVLENFNGAMQRETVMLPYVYERTKAMLLQVTSIFMNEEYVRDNQFLTTDLRIEDHQKFVLEMDLGEDLEPPQEHNEEHDLETYANFVQVCKNYLIIAAEEIRERLERVWRPVECLKGLIPSNAISEDFHNLNENLIDDLHEIFIRATVDQNYNMTLEILRREWNLLLEHNEPLMNFFVAADYDDDNYINNVDEFWYKVKQYRNEQDECVFRNIGQFALNVLCIPHGNSQPERKWSEERLIKTYLRNRLSLPTLNAIMLISDMLKLKGVYDDITKFEPCEMMINVVKNHLYVPNNNNNNNNLELMEFENEDENENNYELENDEFDDEDENDNQHESQDESDEAEYFENEGSS